MKELSGKALEAEILAQDLLRFAERLRGEENTGPTQDNPKRPTGHISTRAKETHLSMARALFRERRLRDQYLPNDLFAEPAWDMLLDLYVARIEQRDVSVSSLSIAGTIPATTGLRWVGVLEQRGLVRRVASALDRRVYFVELTDQATRDMQRYLWRVASEGGAESGTFLLRMK